MLTGRGKAKDEEIRRKPGDIGGNQFCVDELENCKVIVNDICDSMTIDRCTNCELILSAVRGSVFIRDCVDSKFQIVCGQFRCRSCTNCDFFIHVRSGPVVESSKNIRIGCSTLFYPELIDQMNQLKLDPLLNCWTDIHDFTPDEGNFKTTFVQAYGDGNTYPWFTKLNKVPDSWSFTRVSDDSKLYANFQMDGTNPYFAAFTSEPSKKNYFLYEVMSKIDFAATYGKFWPTEGVNFYANPTQNDVVSYLTYMVAKDTEVDPIYWAEVTISINTSDKTITLSVPNSLHYNGSNLTLKYTIG